MKILFISFNDMTDEKYGGGQCSRRNWELLRKYGVVDSICIKKKNNLDSFIALAFRKFPPLTKRKEKEILDTVKKEKYSLVFLDSSLLGSIGEKIKKIEKSIKVVVFCHNVEYDYIDVRIRKGIKHFVYKSLANKQERYSLIYSDKVITLNNRDSNRLNELYGRMADCIFPISFVDKYHKDDNRYKLLEKPIGIFVGAFGRANYEGVKWFVQNSELLQQIEFQIIGKGFESVKDELEQYGCSVIGTVDDLEKYYANAEFVISPILFGCGMKVKIAEALMYGKTIFGTREAFEGYEDEKGDSLYECNDIKEFDTKISDWISNKRNRFNENSRELYLKKYSSDVIEVRFRKLISGK